MSDELRQIKQYFESNHLHLSPEWLESCLHWCKSEHLLPPNYTAKDIQMVVYQQWLVFDLRDVEVPVLPPDLSTRKHFILQGTFSLQIMKIVDISRPKWQQIEHIRNLHSLSKQMEDSPEFSAQPKRMLRLTLTDGVQEVEALEFQPLPQIHLNLPPGSKVKLVGPISVRRGRMLLETRNVYYLGGEVEDLRVQNAPENVLAR